METKANYTLIGAFTILGFIGVLTFFLWFARVELDRQFAYFDVRFPSVSGLGNASDVRFSGLPVGQVVQVRLSPDRDGTILVRVEVAAETPVRADSVATIEAQGVTGVSFVSISSGSPDAPLLTGTEETPIPEIEAGRSVLQTLSEDAPQLVNETLRAVQGVGELLGDENQQRVGTILLNIESASENFAQTLDSFSSVTETINDFSREISRFNTTLEVVVADLSGVLETSDTTIASVGALSEEARAVVSQGSQALQGVQTTIAETERYVSQDLRETTEAVRQMVAELRGQVSALGGDASTLISTLDTTGSTATARLEEARETLEQANALISRLDATATRLDGLLETEGGPLLSETRDLVAEAQRAIVSINAVADAELPNIISNIRDATQMASQTISEVGASLTSASGSIEGITEDARVALTTATATFENANDTLTSINAALETGDRALSAAERAFIGADRVINEDMSGIIAGLQTSLDGLNAAVATVSADLPLISDDLRSASQSAAETFADLRSIANDAAPSVREFASTALPFYTRLAQEARTLIANLDRLTRQIERDPARFLLDRQTPEFRR